MGKPRKNQPGYVEGLDRRGRRTWRKAPDGHASSTASSLGELSLDLPTDKEAVDGRRVVLGHSFTIFHDEGAPPQTAPPAPVDFSGQDLSGVDLSGLDLRGCNFSGAQLRDTDLSASALCDVNLEDADLTGAILKGAYLYNSALSGADLTDAELGYAQITGVTAYKTTFDRCNLGFASVSNSTMSDASFRDVTLLHTILENVVLFRSDFTGAKIAYSFWAQVRAQDAVFTDAEFDETTFQMSNLYDATLSAEHGQQILGDKGFAYDTLDTTIRYNKMSFDEANERLQLEPEEFKVLMWLGEIEVRDNHTGGLVNANFDAEHHHVPEWALALVSGQHENADGDADQSVQLSA